MGGGISGLEFDCMGGVLNRFLQELVGQGVIVMYANMYGMPLFHFVALQRQLRIADSCWKRVECMVLLFGRDMAN